MGICVGTTKKFEVNPNIEGQVRIGYWLYATQKMHTQQKTPW